MQPIQNSSIANPCGDLENPAKKENGQTTISSMKGLLEAIERLSSLATKANKTALWEEAKSSVIDDVDKMLSSVLMRQVRPNGVVA